MWPNKILESVERAALLGKGCKVVLTNGCFDVFTVGHLRLLEAASQLGTLFVAVDSDRKVGALKGVGRPINRLEYRMEILAAIVCVSWVFSFDGDIAEVVEKLRPSFLVKGAEWAGKVRGAEYAGCVVLIEHSVEISSTETLEKMSNADHSG